jgi:undecaprenyl-diphosphatase
MTILQSIILGIVQGITEFLPISSSAHLVITPFLLGWDIPANEAFVFNVLVQDATLIGVIVYFWEDLRRIFQAVRCSWIERDFHSDPDTRLGWLILLATIPAVIIGFLFNGAVKKVFSSPLDSAYFLLVTPVLLVIAEKAGKKIRGLDELNRKDAIWIGIAQAAAIFPGISRSGATIAGGMTRDLQRPQAAKFSLLMSIPVMIAAGVFTGYELVQIPNFWSWIPVFIPGFLTAGVVGYFSIRWLMKYLSHASLYGFAIYCVVMALIVISLQVF